MAANEIVSPQTGPLSTYKSGSTVNFLQPFGSSPGISGYEDIKRKGLRQSSYCSESSQQNHMSFMTLP